MTYLKSLISSFDGEKDIKVIIVGNFYERILERKSCSIDELLDRESSCYCDDLLYADVLKWKISKDGKKFLIQVRSEQYHFSHGVFNIDNFFPKKEGENEGAKKLRIAVAKLDGNYKDIIRKNLEGKQRIIDWEEI